MFGLLLGGLFACVFFAVRPMLLEGQSHLDTAPLFATLPLLAAVGAVVLQMMSHPHGVKDWVQGGVVDVAQADPERAAWTDWAIVMTRRGSVDRRTNLVRLERALFFGLIPLGTVLRPLGEFYRVELRVEERTQRKRNRSFWDEETHRTVGYDYALYLVDRRGDRLCLLDLSTGLSGPGERFVTELRTRLEDVVGRPGVAGRPGDLQRGAPREDRPPPDEFEAWREQQGKKRRDRPA